MNLTGIIQTLASVVSARVSMRLSERLSQISRSINEKDHNRSSKGDGFVERAARIGRLKGQVDRAENHFQRLVKSAAYRLTSSQNRIDQAEGKRTDAQDKLDTAKAARIGGQNAGLKGKDLEKLFDEEERYRKRLEAAHKALQRTTLKHVQLAEYLEHGLEEAQRKVRAAKGKTRANKATNTARDRATVAAHERKPKSRIARAIRTVRVIVQRAIGSKARKATDLTGRGANKRRFGQIVKDVRKARDDLKQAAQAPKPGTPPHPTQAQKVEVARSRLIRSERKLKQSRTVRRLANRFRHFKEGFKPSVARNRLERATQRHQQAQRTHNENLGKSQIAQNALQKAVANNAARPSPQNEKWVERASAAVQKTGAAAKESGKIVEGLASEAKTAGSMLRLAEAAGTAAEVMPVLAVAVAAVAVTIGSAVSFVQRQLAAGEKRVGELRENRSRFSGMVNSSVARYDQQSLQLERRSTVATASSAAGVVESSMRLRESNQARSEEWENIGNKLLAATLDIATFVSDVGNQLDVITPAVSGGLDIITGFIDAIRDPLKKILGNKDPKAIDLNKNVDVLAFGILQAGLQANQNLKDRKRQNKPLPPLR